jgi:type I restriction enzyme S subunit
VVAKVGHEPGGASLGRFKPYPVYKDAGVEWVGNIPAHWGVQRTKHVARLRSGHTPSRQNPEYWLDCTIPWFGLADVWQLRDGRQEYVSETNEKISALGLANSAARLLPKGTVVLSRTASVGFSGIMATEMATTQDFVNWVCGESIRSEYLRYVFRSMTHEFRRLTMGSTHQTIYMPDVGTFSTPVPPIREQDGIVAFIRKETARIDGLVAKKERLIELLQEKRAALITRAVTKGLDPSVPRKDSGVEWLGQIPAHWDAKPLKHLVPGLTVGIVVTPAKYYVDDGVPCLRGLNVASGHIDMNNLVFISLEANEQHRKSKIREGDVLVVRTGQAGAAAVVPVGLDGANCIDLLIIRRSQQLRPWFLYYYFNSEVATSQAELTSVGAIQAHYNTSILAQLLVPVVPVPEQSAIEGYLDEHTQVLDRLVAKVREAVERLKELRTALISAAVTGKIDVRSV